MAHDFEIVKIEDVDPLSLLDSENRITDAIMTNYEFTRLIGRRDFQLKNGDDQPRIDAEDEIDTLEIAKRELYAHVIPLVIRRTVPDGRVEWCKVSQLYIDN